MRIAHIGRLSSKGKRESLDAGIEEVDLERPRPHLTRLAHQLIETRLRDSTGAVGIDVGSMAGTWRFAVDQDLKTHRLAVGPRPQNQMQITRAELVGDPATRLIERRKLRPDGPIAAQAPFIKPGRDGGVTLGHVAS